MRSHAEGSVTVENANIIYAGGLAGSYTGSARTVSGVADIADCYTTATADVTFIDIPGIGSEVYTGGLIGEAIDSAIKSCHAEGDITGEGSFNPSSTAIYTGGLIGQYGLDSLTSNFISITQSYAAGNIAVAVGYIGTPAAADLPQQVIAGGLVGDVSFDGLGSVIVNLCYAEGSVDAEGSVSVYSGGLVGGFNNANAGSGIYNCYTGGTVRAVIDTSGTSAAGGIAGSAYRNIEKCYAAGEVVADGGSLYLGGIVGEVASTGSIQDCAAVMSRIRALIIPTGGHRIIGQYSGPVPANNFGLISMTAPNSPTVITAGNTETGEDASSDDLMGDEFTNSFFRRSDRLAWDFTGIWKQTPGQLPKLQWET
jgi:hypothetical protein